MRKLNLYLLFILFIVSACTITSYEDTKKLEEVKEIWESYPDSALFLLETEFIPNLMKDKYVAEWCMLKGKILNAKMDPIDIDTVLIRRTINYYEKKKLPGPEAQARLYYGRACLVPKEKEYGKIISEYLIALEKAKEAKDDNLCGYITSYLADIHLENHNNTEAKDLYRKGSEFFLKAGNLKSYGFAYRDMGYVCMMKHDFDEALILYLKADSIANIVGDSLLMGSVLQNLGIAYSYKGEAELCEKYITEASYYLDKKHFYATLWHLQMKKGNYELALNYLEKFIESRNANLTPQDWTSYWVKKMILYREIGDCELTLEATEKCIKYQDTIYTEFEKARVAEWNKKYDYSRIAEQNIALANQSNQRLIGILFLILVCLIIYIINRQIVANKNKQLLKTQKELDAQERLRKENEIKLKAKELELKEKSLEFIRQQHELELLKSKEYIAKQSLLKRSLTFKKLNMLSELPTKNINAFKNEVERILGTPHLLEKDWEEIKNEINYVYPDFTERLIQEIPRLTEEEVRFCCLLKVGLDTYELSVLLRINPESVNRRRTRINKKIREIYPGSSWHEFLQEL